MKEDKQIKCRSGHPVQLLCCTKLCKKKSVKCAEDCICNHDKCIDNIGFNHIKEKYSQIIRKKEGENKIREQYKKQIDKLQKQLKQLNTSIIQVNYHDWGIPQDYLKILKNDFKDTTGHDISQFLKKKEYPGVNKKYMMPPIFTHEFQTITQKMKVLKKLSKPILKISEQIGLIDLRIAQVEAKHTKQQKLPLQQYQDMYRILQQQNRRRIQMEKHYPILQKQNKIMKELDLKIIRCILWEVKQLIIPQNYNQALQMSQICEKFFKRTSEELIQQKQLDEYKQSKGLLYYKKGQDDIGNRFQYYNLALQFYETIKNPVIEQLKILIQIYGQQRSNQKYITNMLILQKQLGDEIDEDLLVEIRNFYANIQKDAIKMNNYNLKLLKFYKTKPKQYQQKIKLIYPLLEKYYSSQKQYPQELMYLKQQLQYYPQGQFQIKKFSSEMRIRKQIIHTNQICHNDTINQFIKYAIKKCWKTYEDLSKSIKDQPDNQRQIKQWNQIVLSNAAWFAIKYLTIQKHNFVGEDYKMAIQSILAQCMNQGIKIYKVYYWLSLDAYKSKKQNADQLIKKTLDIYPSEELYLYLGSIYYEKQQFDQSLYNLKKCLSFNSQNYKALRLKAKCNLMKNQFNQAIISFDQLIEKFAAKDDIFCNLGECYEGLYDELTDKIENVSRAEQKQRMKILGEEYLNSSYKNYDRSLQVNQRNQSALLGKARLYTVQKQFDRARKLLKDFFPFTKNKGYLCEIMGNIYQTQADFIYKESLYKDYSILQDALEMYEQANKLGNNQDENLKNIKECLEK